MNLLEVISKSLSIVGILVGIATLALAYRDSQRKINEVRSKKRVVTNLKRLERFSDFFGLPTRKAIRALAGDFSFEIQRLRRQRRPFAAQWNVMLAWGYSVLIILKSPLSSLLRYIVKSVSGFGK